ncbi:TPA: hypothetical protein VA054_001414 [Streptococcus agalactiae]|nr:hypothetical protein [Streptococcus agalactiae]
MTQTLKEISKKLEQLKESNLQEIEKYQTELEAIEPTIEKARQDIIEAKKKVDAAAYDIAKRELWTATNTKELLEDKLDELQHQPLVTKEEYNKLVDEIKTVADTENDAIIKKVEDFFPEFEKLRERHIENYTLANKVLALLENFIGRNTEDYKYDDDGHLLSGRYSGLEYTPKRSVVYLLDSLVEHYERLVK